MGRVPASRVEVRRGFARPPTPRLRGGWEIFGAMTPKISQSAEENHTENALGHMR